MPPAMFPFFPVLRRDRASHPPSPLDEIPDELLEEILSFCSPADLRRASRCSWRMYRTSVRALYRNVRPSSGDKMIAFLITVLANTQLATYVRHLELKYSFAQLMRETPLWESGFTKRTKKMDHLIAPLKRQHPEVTEHPVLLASAALKGMSNLTRLELTTPDLLDQPEFGSRILQNVPFKLQYFHTTLRFDAIVASFLASQPEIDYFRFYNATAPATDAGYGRIADVLKYSAQSPQTCLPKLTTLSWTTDVPVECIRLLVQNRPVRKINLHVCRSSPPLGPLLDIGSITSSKITSLNVSFRHSREPTTDQLKVIGRQFPKLASLGISLSNMTESAIRHIHQAPPSFQHLEKLSIYDKRTENVPDLIQHAKACIITWFDKCPKLRGIYFDVKESPIMAQKKNSA